MHASARAATSISRTAARCIMVGAACGVRGGDQSVCIHKDFEKRVSAMHRSQAVDCLREDRRSLRACLWHSARRMQRSPPLAPTRSTIHTAVTLSDEQIGRSPCRSLGPRDVGTERSRESERARWPLWRAPPLFLCSHSPPPCAVHPRSLAVSLVVVSLSSHLQAPSSARRKRRTKRKTAAQRDPQRRAEWRSGDDEKDTRVRRMRRGTSACAGEAGCQR